MWCFTRIATIYAILKSEKHLRRNATFSQVLTTLLKVTLLHGCLSRPYHFKFLMTVFHKFYLVHSWCFTMFVYPSEPNFLLTSTATFVLEDGHQVLLLCPYIFILINVNYSNYAQHCLKSVQIRSYFWTVFSCIRTEYGDLWS